MQFYARDIFVGRDVLPVLLKEAFAIVGVNIDPVVEHNGVSTLKCEVTLPEAFDRAAFLQALANAVQRAKPGYSVDRCVEVFVNDNAPDIVQLNSPRQLFSSDFRVIAPHV